ncbi:MAG: hypothetical protein LIO46_05020 [Clostridiales bacterium]|nr:hypothetical protein [Clostridiales bacterium]
MADIWEDSYFSAQSAARFGVFLPLHLFRRAVRGKGYLTLTLDNHDNIRINRGRSDDMLKCLMAIHLTLPQVPLIYYGDEIGLPYQPLKSKDGGYHRTGSRTPMQWDNGKNLGFSNTDGALYLPVESDIGTAHTVAAQEADADSLLHTVRRIAALKQKLRCLDADSRFQILSQGLFDKAHPLVYRRDSDQDELILFLKPSHTERTYKLSKYLKHPEAYDSILLNAQVNGNRLVMGKEAFALFYRTK